MKRKAARRPREETAEQARRRSRHCTIPVTPVAPDGPTHSVVDLHQVPWKAITINSVGRGSFEKQTREVLSLLEDAIATGRSESMTVTAQTVFLRDEENREECEALFRKHFAKRSPVTDYVLQAPCLGASLAVEAWAWGGPKAAVEWHSPKSLSVSHDGLRWTHCGGIEARPNESSAYRQTVEVLNGLRRELDRAEAGMGDIVRAWFYQGGITGADTGGQRYVEFNRARTECYRGIRFGRALIRGRNGYPLYPASTGIGMQGGGLAAGCLALKTNRADVRLLPLENPGQVPAYRYDTKYSLHSPKFSRAVAVLYGDYGITWISGTASIVKSESSFPGDIEQQTQQTLDNIERLISPDNFARHGVPGAGATLGDLAKVRVYVKRPEDYVKCRAVCEQRLGQLPAIYAIADICRPELLVEIEGVVFFRLGSGRAKKVLLRQ